MLGEMPGEMLGEPRGDLTYHVSRIRWSSGSWGHKVGGSPSTQIDPKIGPGLGSTFGPMVGSFGLIVDHTWESNLGL